jgi:hypothetical protein
MSQFILLALYNLVLTLWLAEIGFVLYWHPDLMEDLGI